MKYYCGKCHRIYDEMKSCPKCKRALTEGVDGKAPVTVVSAFGIEKDRITAALESADIPFATRAERKEISADAITGLDSARYRIEVPYMYYKRAMDVLVGINAVSVEDYPEADGEPADESDEELSAAVEEFEEMSPSKRTFVRIISIILLILVVSLVIFGVDFIANAVKGLFAQGA